MAKRALGVVSALAALTVGVTACATNQAAGNQTQTPSASQSAGSASTATSKVVTLYFGSYSVTQNIYEKQLFPAFAKYWKAKTGQTVKFQASFDSDGSETKNIVNGLPVDVAALSLAGDMDQIQQAGLITHNWQNTATKGMVTDSIVAIAVRKGNPKHIKTWTDLAKPGIGVDLPNPATSGGAKWDINAIYYATKQASGAASAKSLLEKVLKNTVVLDKSGDASMTTFVNGTGDAAVTYENTILEDSDNLKTFGEVIPSSTMLIENPIAVVDKNVDKHGDRQVAEAFVNWLESAPAQKIFENAGFRPVLKSLQASAAKKFKTPSNLFTVSQLGGWDKINQQLYSTNGIWNQVLGSQ